MPNESSHQPKARKARFNVGEDVLRAVVEAIEEGRASQPLWSRDSDDYVCGKGTVYKIKKAYADGELDRFSKTNVESLGAISDSSHVMEIGSDDSPTKSRAAYKSGGSDVTESNLEMLEDPHIAAIEHWPDLRNAAKRLKCEVEYGVPFAQLLGFPWQTGPDYNGDLIVQSWPPAVSLRVEKDLLFKSLQDHLQHDRTWEILDGWKAGIAGLAGALNTLCDIALQEAGLDESDITHEQINGGGTGTSEFFAKSIVLECINRKFGTGTATHSFEEESRSNVPSVLRWVRNSSSWVNISAYHDIEMLHHVKVLHGETLTRLLKHKDVEDLVQTYETLVDLSNELIASIEPATVKPTFPGGCRLYD